MTFIKITEVIPIWEPFKEHLKKLSEGIKPKEDYRERILNVESIAELPEPPKTKIKFSDGSVKVVTISYWVSVKNKDEEHIRITEESYNKIKRFMEEHLYEWV